MGSREGKGDRFVREGDEDVRREGWRNPMVVGD